jgi:AcrR family transcriptional regulator
LIAELALYDKAVASKKVAKASARKTAKPRQRRTREEGRQLLLEAAEKLLQTIDPDDLGIRDIGALAEVHHRFVAEWFGGKVGLFRAVHDSRASQISTLISTTSGFGGRGGQGLEEIRHEIVLVNWLIQNGSQFDDLKDAFPALHAAKDFLSQTFSLNEEDADKSAHIIGAIIVSNALLRPHVKIPFTPIELIMHHMQRASQS